MEKILVAEDSIIVNQHIYKTLEVAGYKAVSAYSGEEAVQLAREHSPDLILMDIMMETKTDGIEAAQEIKDTLDLPVIFLTALTDGGTLEQVKTSQPYGYIVKPFNEVELLSNIKVAIHKSRAENEVKNNRDLFQSSINSIDQAFILLDSQGNIFYVNQKAEALIGKSFKELVGQPGSILPIYHSVSGNFVTVPHLKTFSKELVFNEELLIRTATDDRPIGDIILKEVQSQKSSGFTLFLFKDISDRVRARRLEKEMEKRRITSLIEGQEHERDRIAREIHDGIGQLVNLIKIKVKGLADNAAKEELVQITEETLKEVRSISEHLHPSQLNDFTLESNIEKLLDQLNSTSEVRFRFSHGDVPALNKTVKSHLFRIVQEAVSNVLKHAQANEATIQLYGFGNELQLTIEDDGVGYDSEKIDQTDNHHGLLNMEYRVNSMKGEFTLDSNVQHGTMIMIKVPIQRNHHAD